MNFVSIGFALFLPIVFALYWMLRKDLRLQNIFVVVASYVFYGFWDWRFLVLIAFTTLCSWVSSLYIDKDRDKRRSQWICGANIVVNLLVLGVFKYYNFFAESFAMLVGAGENDFVLKNLILPVGISFYTFQALSYSIDVYRKKIEPTRDIVAFFAYVSFFPQLVAGPIERATNLLPQFLAKRTFDYSLAVDGSRRMLWGFFKKMIIADNCAAYVNYVWTDYTQQSSWTLILSAVFFVFQVYGDFSGYSDIAIGTSQLFGIRLRDNFRIPFFSRDIAEFWRRWHISLNSWFVDYMYIPLGGSRGGRWMKIRNTFAIFLASGLWHGANWTYVLWGLFHAVCFVPLILLDRTRKYIGDIAPGKRMMSVSEAAGMVMTFMLFTVSMIIFRAPVISDAWQYVASVFANGWGEVYYDRYIVTPAAVSIVVMMVAEWVQRDKRHALDLTAVRCAPVRLLIYYVLLAAIVIYTGKNQTFLYFQF